MAEFVERHMESMTEEIEEMRRLKLYSVQDTNGILKQRKYYECKINGPDKNLQYFTDYIQFEKDLLKNIKLRRSKLKTADRKGNIEVRIMKRIKHLYEIAVQRFSNNFNLSLAYFNFCKKSNFNQAASLVVQNMITNFSHIPEVWEVAAGWHMKVDIKQALGVIHKGLIIHPTFEALYIEAIQFELLTRERDDWPDNAKTQNRDEIIYKKIETYVETIFTNIHTHTCLVKVLSILEPYEFTKNIQYKILDNLMTQYCNDEKVWQFLAERERNGLHYPLPTTSGKSTRFRISRCLEKYEEGLSKICPEKKNVLWTIYLDFLIDLYQEKGVANNLVGSTLLKKLAEGKESSLLTERYYIIWAKLLTDENEILQIVNDGLEIIPDSVELWKIKLGCMVIKDNLSEINKEFKKGHMALKEKAGPLWKMIIKYHILSSPNHILETIYKDAVKQHEQISNLIKPDYIEWAALNKDIEDAREVYKRLSTTPPYCKEFHTKMAKLETTELNINVKELERPLKLACEQFGSQDTDVWINLRDCYLQYRDLFEKAYPTFDINFKNAQIRREAENALRNNAILLADFKDRYDMPVNVDD